tara:strand:- start:25750 stop:26076 length:327 start_codon:yes stop_codon:yes gene_type:complete
MINKLLQELRDSADIQNVIFTEGSCFRLYMILKIIFPKAKAYWSDMDNHCITKIDGQFYDIGGIIKKSYVRTRNYNKINNSELRGYSLLKWSSNKRSIGSRVEKYKNK